MESTAKFQERNKFPKYLWALFRGTFILAIGTGALYASHLQFPHQENFSVSKAISEKAPETSAVSKSTKGGFGALALQARAVYVYDLKTGNVLFAKNENTSLPLASLTKIMTVLTAETLEPKETLLTIRKEFLDTEEKNSPYQDERWKLSDLIDFTLLVSSNSGANAIASVIGSMDRNQGDVGAGREWFISKMNTLAPTFGMRNAKFFNESGLDEGDHNGAYASAKDVTSLFAYALEHYPKLLENTSSKFSTIFSQSAPHPAENTNIIVGEIPSLIASKTGYTELAGGNLIVAFDADLGHPVIISVLGSTQDGRFEDMKKLVDTTITSLN